MLLGVPLLYTMEVWWRGSELGGRGMALMVAVTFLPVIGLIATSGFRRTRDVGAVDIGIDSIKAVALAAVCVLASLLVVGAVRIDGPLPLLVGSVVTELAPFAIGAGLASAVLAPTSGDGDGDARSTPRDVGPSLNRTVADLGGATVGAVVVGLSIAPTDEVPMIAAGRSPLGLLVIVGFSLLISYLIVFEAGFGDQEGRTVHAGLFQHPITETVASYLVALVVSAVMLAFFGRFQLDDPIRLTIEHVVILGLPACVGGAAGRLAV